MNMSCLNPRLSIISFLKSLQSVFVFSFLLLSNSGFAFDKSTLPELQVGMSPSREAWPFANLLEWSAGWSKADSWDSPKFGRSELDAAGYPILAPGQMAYTDKTEDIPDWNATSFLRGRWVLTWEGDAVVDFQGSVILVSGSDALKRKVYDFDYNTTNYSPNSLEIRITAGTNYATNPVRNIRCWMPDPSDPINKSLEPAPGQPEPVWNPLFLEAHSHPGEKVLRFMDWAETNHSNIMYWKDLRGSNYAFQKGNLESRPVPGSCYDGNGDGDTNGSYSEGDIDCENGPPTPVAYQRMIELCNILDKDLWINIPHAATNGFVDSLAMLIAGKDPDGDGAVGLKPNLRVWVEFSNEIWAGDEAFRQGSYAAQQAALEGITYNRWNARRFCQMWSIFQNHLPLNRMVRVAAVWTGDGGGYTLPFLTEINNYGPTLTPATTADVIAITTYFGNKIQEYVYDNIDYNRASEADFDKTFRMWEQLILTSASNTTGRDVTGAIPAKHMQYSKQFGWPLVAYEGGTGLSLIDRKISYDAKLVDSSVESVGGEDFNFNIQTSTLNGRIAGAIALTVDSGGVYSKANAEIVGSTKVNDGAWHHVAVVIPTGATNLNQALLYVDGVLETPSFVSGFPLNTQAYANVKIGNRAEHSANLTGQLDDVLMYSRELNAAEIASVYAGSAVTGNLEGRWQFNDTGDDISGNGRTATLRNGANYSTTKYEGTKSLNASGDNYAEVYDYKGVLGSNARTITAWVKSSSTTNQTIVGYGHPGPVRSELAGLGAVATGEGDINNNPYIEFMLTLPQKPMMAQLYKTQMALVKSSGVYMHSQFGDYGKFTKYGSWGYAEYLNQPSTQTPKRNFIQQWALDETQIRELDAPQNNSPEFFTNPELAMAIVGEPYKAVIEFGGGDGTVNCELISSNNLPNGVQMRIEANQIVIEGTPAEIGFGSFYLMFRLLDADKDPAYQKYTFRCVARSSNPQVIIDFEAVAPANYNNLLEVGDYKFTANLGLNVYNTTTSTTWPSSVLSLRTWGQTITMERKDGANFDLTSFDVTPSADNYGNYLVVTATTDGGATLTKKITMPYLINANKSLIKVALDWVSLKKVVFKGMLDYIKTDGRAVTIDNVLLNASLPNIQQDYDGILKIDANQYLNSFPGGALVKGIDGPKWKSVNIAGASNGTAMQAFENLNETVGKDSIMKASALEYKVNFTKTGIHYVWIKGHANGSANDDAIHLGIDNVIEPNCTDITLNASNSFVWTNTTEAGTLASFKISSIGLHTINLWMKDDGVVIDSIFIKQNQYNFNDQQAPTTPTNLAASGVTESEVTLNWTASSDNIGVVDYDVFKNGAYHATTTANSLKVNGLSPLSAYSFTVLARDLAGNISAQSSPATVNTLSDNVAPSIPSGFTLIKNTGDSLILKWNASTDNFEVTAYEVYKNNIYYTTTTDTIVVISGLTGNTAYSFSVRAGDISNNWSELSAAFAVTTKDNVAPNSPTGVTASNVAETTFTLNWTAATDDVGVTEYQIKLNGANYATTSATTINVTGRFLGVTYSVLVIAKDAAGNSSVPSTPINVTTEVPPTSGVEMLVGGIGADYPTLKAAFDAVNAGQLTGEVKLAIHGNTTETATAVLYASGSVTLGKTSNYTSVKIYPNGANRLISSNMTAVTINLIGAHNVTFDGSIDGIGTDKNLTIENLYMSDDVVYAYGTIQFNKDATYNTIKNCVLKGSFAKTAVTGILTFRASDNTGNGISYNTITNNDFTSSATGPASFCVASRGKDATIVNKENVISNNNFYNATNTLRGSTVVNVENYNKDWTISGNSFYETQTLTSNANGMVATYIRVGGTSSSGINVTGNYIGGSAPLCGGSPLTKDAVSANGTGLVGIEIITNPSGVISNNTIQNIEWSNPTNTSISMIFNGALTQPLLISNNTIGGSEAKKISYSTSVTNTPIFRGINLNSGDGADTITVTGNTISHLYANNTSGTNSLAIDGIYNDDAINLKITSNTISDLYASGTSTGNTQLVSGIRLNKAQFLQLSGNTISNLSSAKTGTGDAVTGIDVKGDITNAKSVFNNFIHSLEATAGTTINGIKINSGFGTFYNNIISLSPASASVVNGIYETGAASHNHNLYHNTIYVGGSSTTGNSYALWVNANTNTRDIRNNIFINQRTNTSGSAKNYGVYFNATGGTFTLNKNNYYINSGSYIGRYGSDKLLFSEWQNTTASEGAGMSVNPMFSISSPTVPADYKPSVVALNAGADNLSVDKDFEGTVRTSVPTIGAFEFNSMTTNLIKTENTVSVYPNPTSNFLNVNAGFLLESVSIVSLTGQKLLEQKVASNNVSLNVSSLALGIYFVSVKSITGQSMQRMFIRK